MTQTSDLRRFSRFSLKIFSFSLLLLLSMTGLFAAAQQEVSVTEQTVSVTDMRDRSVTIPKRIDSVIALGAGSLRLVSYLDAENMVIAVENAGHGREKTPHDFFSLATYRLAFPEFRDLPDIGSAENHEAIIAADPDLIISSTVDVNQLDQLQNTLGIPVIAVNVDVELYDAELFYDQLNMLGMILGKEERAEELVGGIQAAMADVERRTAEVKGPERAYAGGMMFYGPADLLRTTGDYLPFDLTAAQNVMPTNPTGNLQPYMTSLEDLIAAAPDYIFIDAANVRLSESGFRENRRVLEEQVPAFKNRDVYTTFVYKYYGTNWENQLINVYYVGKILYPDLYDDIRIRQKAEEIWDLFFGVPLDFADVIAQQRTGPSRVDWFK
jgi:iron complex transport system substrate-binding protein